MSFAVKPDPGNRKVLALADNLEWVTMQSIRTGYLMLGRDLKATANREILTGVKTGRVYVRRDKAGRRRRHRASAPGETHANRTGTLRKSLGWKVNGARWLEFGYGVDKSAPDYARDVEEGRKNAPRPTLQNAINATTRNAETYVNHAFKRWSKQ